MKKSLTKRMIEVFERLRRTPVSRRELAAKMGVSKAEQKEFSELLDQMFQKGQVVERRQKLLFSKNWGFQTASVVKVNSTFGFVRPEGEDADLFVPGHAMLGAMPKDVVLIRRRPGRGELEEAEILAILEPSEALFSGVLTKRDKICEVTPDSMMRFPVKVSRASARDAQDGDKVLAQIVSRGTRHFDHVAKVLKVYGRSDKAEYCCESIVGAQGVSLEFPEEVVTLADYLGNKPLDPSEVARRRDLRDELIFTIDSADSKDLDDAVSLAKLQDGWKLGVHIADVSHYVRPNTPLDEEAFERGTSIYYADSVIPMLPKALSNGICSLNPGEDRFAFSALMELEEDGTLRGFTFCKSVIRSRVKGVYREINAILDGSAGEELREKYKELLPMIAQMRELSRRLDASRRERGSVELESVESKVLLDENRMAVDVVPRQRGESEEIIENFMLLANQAAATFAMQKEIPFIYRVHDTPTPEKLASLAQLLQALGLDAREIHPPVQSKTFAGVLEQVKGTKYSMIVNNQLLRSMAKAIYSPTNIGHFGLVLKNYAHFTSPIRRYPDLCIHRIMTSVLDGMDSTKAQRKYGEFVARAAKHSSEMEQRAMTIERDCEDCYKAEYMTRHVGEDLDGVITSVTSFGMYVQLPNTVEGMIRVAELGEGYEFDGQVSMRSSLGGISYTVGDPIRIRVAAANVSAGQVDFVLPPHEEANNTLSE